MSGKKCKHCGSSNIEVDPARGDAVCTSCGTVLEDNIIVAEVEFQENAHGTASAIGQFVSVEAKGGATGFGGAFTSGIGQESREITLRKARDGIVALCQQLRLNQQCIDIACNFFKMALSRHLTNGRQASHTQAACVYMTCRTEGTPHLLIDISDALQICCYQLGRTYFKLSKALCINIPPTDPCLYILRFASQLQLGAKQHEVSTTALRLVQRMKRDSIHSGRRPSGVCGAALLMAARLHEFSRTPADVVRIVKVHKSTIKKRLLEFGETPSSALTLDEFMTVDLEEEQDPPAFRAARKRDKERLQKLMEEGDGERELSNLQRLIEEQLDQELAQKSKFDLSILTNSTFDDGSEDEEASRFAAEDTVNLIGDIFKEVAPTSVAHRKGDRYKALEKGLGPELAVIGLGTTDCKNIFLKPEPKFQLNKDLVTEEELMLSAKDEEDVDSLIMSDDDVLQKSILWNKINAGYLKDQKIKEEVRAREKEESSNRKKKVRGSYKKKATYNSATAGEAVEKMLAEKRISMKINYDILKSLNETDSAAAGRAQQEQPQAVPSSISTAVSSKRRKKETNPQAGPPTPSTPQPRVPTTPRREAPALLAISEPPSTPDAPAVSASSGPPSTPAPPTPALTDAGDDYEEELEAELADGNEVSLADMLQSRRDEGYSDYEDY